MAYSARFWAIDDELTMTDPASDPGRYTRLQKRYLKLREDEFDAARLSWLDATQWAVCGIRPTCDRECANRSSRR